MPTRSPTGSEVRTLDMDVSICTADAYLSNRHPYAVGWRLATLTQQRRVALGGATALRRWLRRPHPPRERAHVVHSPVRLAAWRQARVVTVDGRHVDLEPDRPHGVFCLPRTPRRLVRRRAPGRTDCSFPSGDGRHESPGRDRAPRYLLRLARASSSSRRSSSSARGQASTAPDFTGPPARASSSSSTAP